MQNELESIWADGIPSKIDPKDRIEPEGILKMCLQYTMEHILKDKYKILAAGADIGVYPNLLVEKDGTKYAISVIPCIYPSFLAKADDLRIKIAQQAKKVGMIPVLCPVPIFSIDSKRAEASIYLKGDVFKMVNMGQLIMTDAAEQEILPDKLDFKL